MEKITVDYEALSKELNWIYENYEYNTLKNNLLNRQDMDELINFISNNGDIKHNKLQLDIEKIDKFRYCPYDTDYTRTLNINQKDKIKKLFLGYRWGNDKRKKNFALRNKIVFKSRAENYSIEEINALPTINHKLYFQLFDFFSKKYKYPRFLFGGKGFGKTFNVIKASFDATNNNEKTPSIFIFKRNKFVELFKPIEKTFYKQFNIKDVIKKSNLIVFDDLHYLCESVMYGETSFNVLYELLLDSLKVIKLNRIPILFVSEDMLSGYAEIIDEERFDKLLPHFGEARASYLFKLPPKERINFKNNINYVSQLQLPISDFYEFSKILIFSGYNLDNLVRSFLYFYANGNPRVVSNFVNEFDTKDITEDLFIDIAVKKLKYSSNKTNLKYIDFIKKLPLFLELGEDSEVKYNDIIWVKKDYKSFEKLEEFVDGMYNICDKIDKNLKDYLEKPYFYGYDIETKNKIIKILNEKEISKKIYHYIRSGFEKYSRLDKNPGVGLKVYDWFIQQKIKYKFNDIRFKEFWDAFDMYRKDGVLDKPFKVAFEETFTKGVEY